MKRVEFLSDWKNIKDGLFYFSYVCIELSLGRIALFHLGIEPTVPGMWRVSVFILGVGVGVELGKKQGGR